MIACSILGFVISLLLLKPHSIQAPIVQKVDNAIG